MWQKVPLLYSCGFQNTWVISMVLPFITEFGVLWKDQSCGRTNLLWCCRADLQRRDSQIEGAHQWHEKCLTQQITWEDMIIHLLSKILDVIDDPDWTQSFGNAFAKPIWPFMLETTNILLCYVQVWSLSTWFSWCYGCFYKQSVCFKETVYMPRNFLASATLRNTVDIAKETWVETCDFPPWID